MHVRHTPVHISTIYYYFALPCGRRQTSGQEKECSFRKDTREQSMWCTESIYSSRVLTKIRQSTQQVEAGLRSYKTCFHMADSSSRTSRGSVGLAEEHMSLEVFSLFGASGAKYFFTQQLTKLKYLHPKRKLPYSYSELVALQVSLLPFDSVHNDSTNFKIKWTDSVSM